MANLQQPNQEQLIFRSRFQLLLNQYYVGVLINVVVAVAVAYVLWSIANHDLLLAWAGLLVVLSLVRALYVRRILTVIEQLDFDNLKKRYHLYLFTLVLTGSAWGLLGSILFPFHSLTHQVFVVVVLASMLGGAVAIMYPLSRAYHAYAIPLSLPMQVSLYLYGGAVHVSMGLLALLYLVAMLIVIKRAETTLINSFKVQYENTELLKRLAKMGKILLNARDELEERVAERTNDLSRLNQNLNAEIDERKRIEDELFNQKELAEITLRSIAEGIVTTDKSGKIVYVNAKAEMILDCKLNDVYQKYFTDAARLINEETGEQAKDQIELVLKEKKAINDPQQYLILDHATKGTAIRQSIAPIFNKTRDLIGLIIVIHDVTRDRFHQLQLSHIATHDSLTGLHNRYAFEQQLGKIELNQDGRSEKTAIIYIDLDHFKIVNDSCGHLAGDELLKQLSELLVSHIGKQDMLARIGGDEFGAILHASDVSQVIAKAELLLKTIRSFRFLWVDRTFSVGASIGLVFPNDKIPDIQECLRYADMACFIAKEKGGKRIHVYVEEDEEMLARHNELNRVRQLSEAMEHNGLLLYKQDILRIDGKKHDQHYEVLLRLRNAKGEIILPGAFISAAERYNFMQEVDRWVIGKVFEFAEKELLFRRDQSCTVNINLSGLSLTNEKTLQFITDRLSNAPFPGNLLCFEITETTAIKNFSKAISFIEQLKKYDCKFAIDDFGSGVSSLGYLKNLPVDYVKIDGSFVRDIDNDEIDYAMVESIHKVVSLSGKKTIAEYVESDDVLKLLQQIGVDYAQGYAIAKPKSLVDEAGPELLASL